MQSLEGIFLVRKLQIIFESVPILTITLKIAVQTKKKATISSKKTISHLLKTKNKVSVGKQTFIQILHRIVSNLAKTTDLEFFGSNNIFLTVLSIMNLINIIIKKNYCVSVLKIFLCILLVHYFVHGSYFAKKILIPNLQFCAKN